MVSRLVEREWSLFVGYKEHMLGLGECDREFEKQKKKKKERRKKLRIRRLKRVRKKRVNIMFSREHKRAAALHEKLQLLRSITNSHAENDTAIIVDASKYIEELKQKVDRLNQDIVNGGQSSNVHDSLPSVTVETLEKGFLINVCSNKNCPGLLVSVLEAFEELNLTVVEARASCKENFQLEAISVESDENSEVDAEVVRRAVMQAIRQWTTNNTDQQDQ